MKELTEEVRRDQAWAEALHQMVAMARTGQSKAEASSRSHRLAGAKILTLSFVAVPSMELGQKWTKLVSIWDMGC